MSLTTLSRICFIGAGNMAQAIIKGLLAQGLAADKICATTSTASSARQVSQSLGIECINNNAEAVSTAELVVLAVKPQVLREVCQQLAPALKPGSLVLSVAAGIRSDTIQTWLGEVAVARSMPNTPSAIGLGASGLYCSDLCNAQQRQIAKAVLEAVGLCIEVEHESQIDAVTAVSGSGPAYFFLFIEAMIAAAQKLGLDQASASTLALQTACGAAELARQSDIDVAELRHRVTSPKGTTEQAINYFEAQGLRDTVTGAMQACAQRAAELSDLLGSSK